MVSYYNYPSYNDKSYEVRYPDYNSNMLIDTLVYNVREGRTKYKKLNYKTIKYDSIYFRNRFNFYRDNLYRFENYLTDEEKEAFDRYVEYDALNKYIKDYSKLRSQVPDLLVPPYTKNYAMHPVTTGRKRHRQINWYFTPRFYSETELRNLYPGLEDREYREDIQALLSLASVREARQRGIFSRPTYSNEDVLRYLFYTGSLDNNLYLRTTGKKLFVNDPVIQRDLKVVQKVQKKLGMQKTIGDIIDFGYPATNDIQLGSSPHPSIKKSDNILQDLNSTRKLGDKVKDAVRGNGRSEVIPANRIAERFFEKNPLIYRLINQKHGNRNVLV